MMAKKLSQEGLKLIAGITMLLDHIGAAIVYDLYLDACMVNGVDMLGTAMPAQARVLYRVYYLLRIIGRLAFPIYCFLLAEGAARTRDPKKYGLRLLIGMLLAEIPFDLVFYGGLTWQHQSVMVTLVLGFLMIQWVGPMEKAQFIPVIVCAAVAELLGADYGAWGVVMIALFSMTRNREDRKWIQILSLGLVCWLMDSAPVAVGPVQIPIQMFAVAALVPIFLYSGRKVTAGKAVQWMFYLFYPVHLLVLWIITLI